MKRSKFQALLFIVALMASGCVNKDVARGHKFARERRWTEAIKAYKRALARYPRNYEAAWGITKIYCFTMHVAPKCIDWSTRLVEIYPDDKEYRRAARTGYQDSAREARKRGDHAAAKEAETLAASYSEP